MTGLSATLLLAAIASGETLTGISKDGAYYRLDEETVCKPLRVGSGGAVSGWPECQSIPRKAQEKMSFQKPKPGMLLARFEKKKVTLVSGKKVVAVWNGHPEVVAVEDVYESADGKTAVVVYDFHSEAKATVVMAHVGFRLK